MILFSIIKKYYKPFILMLLSSTIIKIQSWWRGIIIRHKSILIPANPNDIDINYDLLKIYIKTYIDTRQEYYNDTNTNNLELEAGFSEWWIKKASYGRKIGDGNCPMDVITKNNKAIDTMCLCLNGNQTNEKSIMQNFNISGNNLDNFFIEKKENEATKLYMKDYIKKIIKFAVDYNISKNDLYYCIFISTNKNVFLSIYKINIYSILFVKSDGFTKQLKSIKLKNFIDEKDGNVKLYKSKKRLELRINKDVLNNFNTIKLY